MKYLVLIGDGMTDLPLKALGGKTPLEAAKTPNMDFMAQNGLCGWVNNVPQGMQPASDVANMSIFGYDPQKYYTGRGPLEAASLGVKLAEDEIAFRCNLVTVEDGKMKDFTAGQISTPEAKKIMLELDRKLGRKGIKFFPGLSYRHLLRISNLEYPMSNIVSVPPHDITGKKIHNYLPKGEGAELLVQLMNESEVLLHEMKTKATMIWPWSPGRIPNLPLFRKKYGLKGAVITAVHLLKGLGKILGLDVINVPGATGYLDTNYIGKAKHALAALKKHDIVFVHVEAPDEAGHEGNIKHKIKAIEDFDKLIVGTILEEIRAFEHSRIRGNTNIEYRILVLPDHPTPIAKMTHTTEPVPFVIYEQNGPSGPACRQAGPVKAGKGIEGYNEKEMKKAKLEVKHGHELLGKFLA